MTPLQARMTKVVLCGVLFLSAVLLVVPSGFANAVNLVANPSFEILPTNADEIACNHHQPGCFFTLDHIPDWTNSPANSGQLKPSITGAFPVFHEFAPGNGEISAFVIGGGTISQDVGTVKKGLIYDFSVDIGHVLDLGFGGSADVELSRPGHAPEFIDATTTTGHMPDPGRWSTFTASFVGNSSNVGDQITIQLKDSGRGNQGNFDSVTLTAVPEPGTLLLFGTGLLLLGTIGRKLLHA